MNVGGFRREGLGILEGLFLTEARRARRWWFECRGAFAGGFWEVLRGVFLTEARRARRWWFECRGFRRGLLGGFERGVSHGGHGGGGLNVGGFRRGVLGILEGVFLTEARRTRRWWLECRGLS